MATLREIEDTTRLLADNRELLKLRVENLHTAIEELKREHMKGIKEAAADTANTKTVLEGMINDSRHLFQKPKSIIISGIRVGLKKGAGAVIFDDEDLVIARIKKIFNPEDHDTYIKITEKVRKKALEELDTKILKRLGVTIEGNGEVVLIKAVDSDVDKIVNAMLKEASGGQDEMEEAA